jgi:flagellar biosynthesis/type III secretory pathway chaperone
MMQTMEMSKDLDSLYDSLIDILRREIEVYREIQEVIQSEKRILMKPSLDELHESNARKETWILKAKLLEEVRGNIVRKIALALGLAEEKVTLSALVSGAGDHRREALRECQSTLGSLFQGIRDLNERNKVLIDTSLVFLKNSLGFINDLVSPRTGYLGTGRIKAANRNGKILSVEG